MQPESRNRAKGPKVPGSHFDPSQAIENVGVPEGKKRPPNPSRFKFERVNEVTWKLTDGELTNVPRSHGQWGGYRTTKALAWVIDVGASKPAWIARCHNLSTNPSSLAKAKAAAIAMAKGAAGDYRVASAVHHLNGLTARLAERFSDAA